MKTNKIVTAILACSLIGAVNAAPTAQWATKFANQKTSLLTGKINSPVANNNHEAVSFSYKLASDEQLNFDVRPFKAESRQYWLDSSSDKLAVGINLPVSGGETIIRISPLTNDKSVQLSANNVQIQNNGEFKNIQVFADSADLKTTGAAFSDQSIALKINSTAGQLNLKVDTQLGDIPFVIHVLEKDSPFVLSLNANQATYNANQTISINAGILDNNKSIDTNLQGYINRPDGSILGGLTFAKNLKGNYIATLDAVGSQGLAQGLWEVHVFAKSNKKGVEIMRDAQTSFAVNLNSAEFSGNLKMENNKITVGINVGVEGRYEVRGVLMGTNKSGVQQPVAMTMSANWLNVGEGTVSLPMDAKIIRESGLSAPFSIKNIQLTNQTYLAPVQNIKAGINLIDFNFSERIDMR